MEKTVQNLLQCLRNVICGEDVPLIAMSETEQEKFYQMSLAQDMAEQYLQNTIHSATVLMFIPVPAICFALTAGKLKKF